MYANNMGYIPTMNYNSGNPQLTPDSNIQE